LLSFRLNMKKDCIIEAAIFDLDGLMLDTEIVSYQGWKLACSEFGFELDDETYHKIIGLVVSDMRPIFEDVFGRGFPLEEADRKRLGYMYEHFEKYGVSFKPGLAELLDFLEKAGLPKAVATSSCRESAMKKLTAGHLVNRFAAIVTGDDVKNGKPAADIFLAAAERLHVQGERCLVFEDSENGVRAAYNAGMPAIMVPDVKQPTKEIAAIAYKIFSSLADSIPLLQGLLGTGS
jgi:HAD superfamily hydrolase (TIGR01509 family)